MMSPKEKPAELGDSSPHLSIITSLYLSEPTVAEFIARTCTAAEAITDEYEIILVNDGSPDRVGEVVVSLMATFRKVCLVDLSRNFGQLPAIHAGLCVARGEYIFIIDSDLEEPPELLCTFYNRIREAKNTDVIYGIRKSREEPILRALTSKVFYWVFERITDFSDLSEMLLLRIMTRRFLDAYLKFGDYHLFIAGLSSLTGFRKEAILVDKLYKGSSGYSFGKRLVMASDAILSFSTKPLYWLFTTSLLLAIILGVAAGGVAIARLMNPEYQAGWTSLIISIWLVGTIIVNSVAMVGLYIAKIFEQVKNRPRFIVRQVYRSNDLS